MLTGALLQEAVSTSRLLSSVMRSHAGVSGVRYLSALTRGPLSLHVSDWVLLRDGPEALIANVSEMALISMGSHEVVVRLLCQYCQRAPTEDADGMLRVQKGSVKTQSVLVDFDRVAVMALSHEERAGGILEFRYLF